MVVVVLELGLRLGLWLGLWLWLGLGLGLGLGLEETMLVSWENVRCTATQMVKELCYAAFSLEKKNMMWKNKFFL